MNFEPFIGSLCSATGSTFGPNVSTSSLVLSKISMDESNLLLEVSLQHLDYEPFSLEEFTHIVVGIVFQVQSDNIQYTRCLNWCHIKQETVKNVEIKDALIGKSLTVVSCGIIPKQLFLEILLKNISDAKLDQVDRKVMDQFFNTSLEKFIEKLHFIQTSKYLSNYERRAVTDIETVCKKTKDISVNKINKLFKQLTSTDWSNTLLHIIKVICKFVDLLKTNKVLCESIKQNVIQRAQLCSVIGEKDIKYFVPSEFYDFKTECNKYVDLYLLIFCKDFVDKDVKQFDYVYKEFLKLKQTQQNSRFMLVDFDLLSEELAFTPSETVICHLKNGCFLSYNALIDEIEIERPYSFVSNEGTVVQDEIEVGKNYVLFSESDIEEFGTITNWSLLCIPCPGLHLTDKQLLWNCKFCNKNLCFSFDSYIFCACGRIKLTKCNFVCTVNTNDTHVTDEVFVTLTLEPTKGLNLMILGQNDEDINIWRNNFYYYLSSLDDSTQVKPTLKQLQNMIANEKLENNKKESLLCISNSANKKYNLFSMPGVCPNLTIVDPEDVGIVLESVKEKLECVHGICIIINAVDTRIKLKFKYFIEEILTYFHNDAMKNVLFCVASSDDTKENTKVALEKVLKEINVSGLNSGRIYFIENRTIDEVRAAKLSETETHDGVLDKWCAAEAETKKLFDYISATKPHDMSLSVELMKGRIQLYTHYDRLPILTSRIIPYHSTVLDYLNLLLQSVCNGEQKKALEEKVKTHNKIRKVMQ